MNLVSELPLVGGLWPEVGEGRAAAQIAAVSGGEARNDIQAYDATPLHKRSSTRPDAALFS